jgi:hypothetical protein
MPQMFRPNGISKMFKSIDAGTKAGFWLTFNDMAAAVKAGKTRPDEPEQAKEPEPELQTEAPVPPVETVVAGGPKPPESYKEAAEQQELGREVPGPKPEQQAEAAPAPRRPLPDMELGEVKKLAEQYGLDPSVHHMTLRAQVEEKINAEGGCD